MANKICDNCTGLAYGRYENAGGIQMNLCFQHYMMAGKTQHLMKVE